MNYMKKKFKFCVSLYIRPVDNRYYNITRVYVHTQKHALQIQKDFFQKYNTASSIKRIGK